MDEDEEMQRFRRELEQFRGVEERLAQAAFDRLVVPSRRYVYALLRNDLSRDDQDEIVQVVLAKVWQSRNTFRNQGRASWFAWLKRITHNAYVDWMRTKASITPPTLGGDVGIEGWELEIIECWMTMALAKQLFYFADVALLELDETLPPEEQDRRLLAAQYYYIEAWSVEDLLDHLSATRPEAPPVLREQLDSWLESPGTLRYLIYRELYFSPERLTAQLLGLPDTSTTQDLNRVLSTLRETADLSEGLNGWSALEAQAILWRYFRGLSAEEVGEMSLGSEISEHSDRLFVKCATGFPFVAHMRKLCAWVDTLDCIRIKPQRLLGSRSGIWYRLAFEYRYRQWLPHRDIQERVHAAANVVHYTITLDMLNTWLSGGRLLNRLKQYL